MGQSVNASSLKNFSNKNPERYFKISLSEKEMRVYHHKIQRVNSFFKENEHLLNMPELYRVLLMNLDDPSLMSVLLDLYKKDAQAHFKPSLKVGKAS